MNYARIAATRPDVSMKPNDMNQTTSTTKSDLSQEVNPVDSGIFLSKVKPIKGDAGLIIDCNSTESAAKK